MDLKAKKDLLDMLVTLGDLELLVKMDHQGTLERRVTVAKMAYLGNLARKVLLAQLVFQVGVTGVDKDLEFTSLWNCRFVATCKFSDKHNDNNNPSNIFLHVQLA